MYIITDKTLHSLRIRFTYQVLFEKERETEIQVNVSYKLPRNLKKMISSNRNEEVSKNDSSMFPLKQGNIPTLLI